MFDDFTPSTGFTHFTDLLILPVYLFAQSICHNPITLQFLTRVSVSVLPCGLGESVETYWLNIANAYDS